MITLPLILTVAVCLVVLLIRPAKPSSAYEHFASGYSEREIFAGNIATSLSLTYLWLLYVFSFKGYGYPSLICVVIGVVVAHGLYIALVLRRESSPTVLGFFHRGQAPPVIVYLYFFFALAVVGIECALFRIFLTEIANQGGASVVVAYAATGALGIFCMFYTYRGGLSAVLRTDLILLVVVAAIAVWFVRVVGWGPAEEITKDLLRRDFDLRHFESQRALGLTSYGSTAVFMVFLFLSVPDYWHRNVFLRHKSRRRRVGTLGASALFTLLLLCAGYILAVHTRSASDWEMLTEQMVTKSYDVQSVVSFILSLGPYAGVCLAFVLMVSFITSVDSVLIACAAFAYHNRMTFESLLPGDVTGYRYRSMLIRSLQLAVVVLMLSMIANVETVVTVALVVASAQLLMFCTLVYYRAIGVAASEAGKPVVAGLLTYGALTLINAGFQLHFWAPWLALISVGVPGLWGMWQRLFMPPRDARE